MSLFRSLEDERVKKLKTLKYGDSKPLITKDIPLGTEFQDGPNPRRNGLELQAGARVDDLLRINKLLASKPGLKFVTSNTLLNFSQAQATTNKSGNTRTALGRLISRGIQGAASTAQVIAASLAQVPVSGTGQHFTFGFNGDKGYLQKEGAPLVKQGAQILPTAGDTGIPSDLKDLQSIYGLDQANSNLFPPPDKPATHTIDSTKYPTQVKKDVRYGLGSPGKRTATIGSREKVDLVNAAKPTDSSLETDLIKFNFQIITPPSSRSDENIDPSKPKIPNVQFRAFLDSLDDSFNADWSEHRYIGRGESFYTYEGFNRNINISFKIAAQSEAEMKPLYEKIVYLASTTAPTYSSNFMRGTIVRVTVGDYLYRIPGVINTVNYTWDKTYPWQIQAQNDNNLSQELPTVLNCSVSFMAIHDFVPQTGLYNFITSTDNDKAYFKNGVELRDRVKALPTETRSIGLNQISAPTLPEGFGN